MDETELRLTDGVHLAAELWRNDGPQVIRLEPETVADSALGGGTKLRGRNDDARVELTLEPKRHGYAYTIELRADKPTRVRLRLTTGPTGNAFHLIPAVIFGENSYEFTSPLRFSHLLADPPAGEPHCAKEWEFRADRASHPISMLHWDAGWIGISCDAYIDDADGLGPTLPTYAHAGLYAGWLGEAGSLRASCGVTLGYRNHPATYVSKNKLEEAKEDLLLSGSMRGRIFLSQEASDPDSGTRQFGTPTPGAGGAPEPRNRLGAHRIIRSMHAQIREPAEAVLTVRQGIELVTRAIARLAWIPEEEDWADLKWDFETAAYTSLRGANHEIGWTGGAQTALPMLRAGTLIGDSRAKEQAQTVLERIAAPEAINPDSGFFWDIADPAGRHLRGWWVSGATPAHHFAYTNGQAAAYLLAAADYLASRDEAKADAWRATALHVVDRVVRLQQADGGLGYSYDPAGGSVSDAVGFAGCWWVPALARAAALSKQARYVDAAERAMTHYRTFVRELNCYGTPMDTGKAVDQEGVLAFIRASRLLYQLTGEAKYVRMLEEGAEYEYLWRFAYKTRPSRPPLSTAGWNACGGSITSVSNPHIHPMGLQVAGDLRFLAQETDDEYHRYRWEESIAWILHSLSIYPDGAGYGEPGVLTERFCPSDGLLRERWPDGSPASVWFTFHIWAAATALEGLLDAQESGWH
jgi:hypothetical protein